MIHVDLNGDCVYEPGEPLLAGVTVQLLNAQNQVVATTVTDQNGQYQFTGLRAGSYSVHEVAPAGYFEFGDSVGSAGGTLVGIDTIGNISLAAGVNATDYDFCVQGPSSISGMVHVDLNGDCKWEPGEPLLAGVTIQLLDSNNQIVGTAVTDQNGMYSFTGLKAGTYTVHEVQPAGFTEFGDSVGSVGGTLAGVDTITNIPLGSSINATDYDFCEQAKFGILPPSTFSLPSLQPMANPPTPVIIIPVIQGFNVTQPFGLYYGGGYAYGYTWHLSVIDAGEPRGTNATAPQISMVSMKSDPFAMEGEDVHNSEWMLGNGESEEGVKHFVRFGMRNGIPVTGDFNGDGITDVGFFYAGEWFIDLDDNGQWDQGDLWAKLGHEGDLRLPAIGTATARPTSASLAAPGRVTRQPFATSRACPRRKTPRLVKRRTFRRVPTKRPSASAPSSTRLKEITARTSSTTSSTTARPATFRSPAIGTAPAYTRSACSTKAAGCWTATAMASGPRRITISITELTEISRSSATSTATASTNWASIATAHGTSTRTTTACSTRRTSCSNLADRATWRSWATGTGDGVDEPGVYHQSMGTAAAPAEAPTVTE